MAIAYDNATTSYHGQSNTVGFTVGSGSNRILFVGIYTANSSGGDVVSGVTYAGSAMTRINTVQNTQSGHQCRAYLYYLLNPTSGANNIVVTSSETVGLSAVSYTGAQQSGVPDASNTGTANYVSSVNVTTTTVANNCWVVAFAATQASSLANGTNLTVRSSTNTNGGIGIGDYGPKTPAGGVTQTFADAGSNSDYWAICTASFVPGISIYNQSITVTAIGLLSFNASRLLLRSLSVTATGFTSFTKQISKTFSVGAVGIASFTQNLIKKWNLIPRIVGTWTPIPKPKISETFTPIPKPKVSETWTNIGKESQ